MALVELDEDHCATCFADGIQVATGCTFGKGNIKKLHYGKWGVTLIDKKRGKAVRVAPLAAAMERNSQSEFMAGANRAFRRRRSRPRSRIPWSTR